MKIAEASNHQLEAHTHLRSSVLLPFAFPSMSEFPLALLIVIDSGASHHMFNYKQAFLSLTNLPYAVHIKLGDGKIIKSTKGGMVKIRNILLQALYVPAFRVSLISVSCLGKTGFKTVFERDLCIVKDTRSQQAILSGKTENGIYILQLGNSHHSYTTGALLAIHHLRRIGCTAYHRIPDERIANKTVLKFGERPKRSMMRGYTESTKTWKLWDP